MSQRLTILKMLRAAPGNRVTGEQLIVAGIWRYAARIEELRKGKPHGPCYDIRTEGDPHSPLAVYRLVNDPACDVESSRSGLPAAAALSVTDGVERGDVAREARRGGIPSLSAEAASSEAAQPEPACLPSSARGAATGQVSAASLDTARKPLSPYEYDLLGEAA